MNEREMMERLERIEEKERRRVLYGKLQLILIAAAVIALAVVIGIALPKAQELYTQGKAVLGQAGEMMDSVQPVLDQVDFSKLEKLEGLDVDGLNRAIEGINQAMERMEKFFSLFKWEQ